MCLGVKAADDTEDTGEEESAEVEEEQSGHDKEKGRAGSALCHSESVCACGPGAELGRMFKAGSPATQGLRLSVKTEDKRGVG